MGNLDWLKFRLEEWADKMKHSGETKASLELNQGEVLALLKALDLMMAVRRISE